MRPRLVWSDGVEVAPPEIHAPQGTPCPHCGDTFYTSWGLARHPCSHRLDPRNDPAVPDWLVGFIVGAAVMLISVALGAATMWRWIS